MSWDDCPTCNVCGETVIDWWDGVDANVGDGDTMHFTCDTCGNDFSVVMCITTTFCTVTNSAAEMQSNIGG